MTAMYSTCVEPVLLIGFNRPEFLKRVIDQVRLAAPPRVYLAIDGPRLDREDEGQKVAQCQQLAKSIDWDCQVHTLFQERNLGCGLGVSTAISWFFEHEERGIILEDDLIPDSSFFPFCSELLDRYETDSRVFAISGSSVVPRSEVDHPENEYRFSQVPHVWGWATWRRSWAQHRLEIAPWRKRLPIRTLWRRSGRSAGGTLFWAMIFELLARDRIDTWDGQLVYASMVSGQLTATSNENLTHNIGFGEEATHTIDEHHAQVPVGSVILPTAEIPVEVDSLAQEWTRINHFDATLMGMTKQAMRYFRRSRRGNAR